MINYVPVENCDGCIYMFDSLYYQNLVISDGKMSHVVFCGQIYDVTYVLW